MNPLASENIPINISLENAFRYEERPLTFEEAYLARINHFVELGWTCPEDNSSLFDSVIFRDNRYSHWIPSCSIFGALH